MSSTIIHGRPVSFGTKAAYLYQQRYGRNFQAAVALAVSAFTAEAAATASGGGDALGMLSAFPDLAILVEPTLAGLHAGADRHTPCDMDEADVADWIDQAITTDPASLGRLIGEMMRGALRMPSAGDAEKKSQPKAVKKPTPAKARR